MKLNKGDQRLNHQLHYLNGTPRNREHITDNTELINWEYQFSAQVAIQLKKHPWQIKSLDDLQFIHRAMFGKFFYWAGKYRFYQTQKMRYQGSDKSSAWFLRTNSFNNAIYYINNLITKDRKQNKLTKLEYTNLLDAINYLHPFSNGNGRATKTFLQILALDHHQHLNYEFDIHGMNRALNAGNLKKIAKYLRLKG